MQSWVKIVKPEEIEEGKLYFVGRVIGGLDSRGADFWSRLLNGKQQFSSKPGIAIRFVGGDELREFIATNQAKLRGSGKLVAIEVPEDADRRWRARGKVKWHSFRKTPCKS